MVPMKSLCHLGKELELNGLEAPDELQMNTVTQQATKPNPQKPQPTCHHCKKPGHYCNQSRQLEHEKYRGETNKISASNNNNNNNTGETNSNHNNKNANISNNHKANNRNDRKLRTAYPRCDTCGKSIHSTMKCYFGANAAHMLPPRNERPMGQS